MKLSEAIRLGAMLRPQGFGSRWTGNGSKSCAFGAALDAIGHHKDQRAEPTSLWPISALRQKCPECGLRERACVIGAHLNDKHLWPREHIADWFEAIERENEPLLVGREQSEVSPELTEAK